MKLIDRMLTTPAFEMPRAIGEPWRREFSQFTGKLHAMIKQQWPFPVITVDNVAEYYYRGTDQEDWDIKRDFPNLAPPYPMFWMEHTLPDNLRSEKYGVMDFGFVGKRAKVGALYIAVDPSQAKLEKMHEGDELPEGTRWLYLIEMFEYWGIAGRDEFPEGPLGTYMLCVDEQGRLLGQPWTQGFFDPDDPEVCQYIQAAMCFLHPHLLAISFMHCKNVVIEDNVTPEKLAKRTFERHGYRPAPHKTLVIEPLKQVLRHEGGSEKHGLAKAMHICRGHFKDYRQGKGLFGKLHQLVWHPFTVRGTQGDKPAPREIKVKTPKVLIDNEEK